MAILEQLVRINARQLATATDRILYASTPRTSLRAPRDAIAQAEVRATASRMRAWIAVAIVVAALVAAALVGHSGPEVVVHDACVARA
jgi:hypothetical protein